MSQAKIIVQKYGGSTLESPEKIKAVAKKIAELSKSGVRVVAAVSAMGKTTNQLIDLAQQVSKNPSRRELDMLLSTGERVTMALMSMALQDLGVSAISFTGSQAGILTTDSHFNAQITDVKAFRVEEALNENKVVVLAGFQGVSPTTKEITTLGRGGTDTTAVAMAGYLKADACEILKDVDGVYTADPKLVPDAQVIKELSLDQMLEMTLAGAQVLHSRSVEMAILKNVELWIGPAGAHKAQGTQIRKLATHNNQKALGLNSFDKVLAIEISGHSPNTEFKNYLDQYEIADPVILKNEQNKLWLAGPKEILAAIERNISNSKSIRILNSELSSVTATFSTEAQNSQGEFMKQILDQAKITVVHFWTTKLSTHFIVASSDRKRSITELHRQLI